MNRLFLILLILNWRCPAAVPCAVPTGDQITAADIVRAVPRLAGLPSALTIGYAPVPGLERVFHPDELLRLARAHGLADPGLTGSICFAWPLAALRPERLREAMERELTGRAPKIELITQSLAPVPPGEVVFPLSGLSAYSEKPVVWKGYVRYAGTRRFNVWASVRVCIRETHFRAQGVIHAGEKLAEGRWRGETYEGPLLHDPILRESKALNGLIARREFPDGALLLAPLFDAPKAVERGDTVTVLAGSGAAHVEAPGIALGGGVCDDIVLIRNPRSNRTFKARILSPGRVEVLAGTSAGLAGAAVNGDSL